MSKYIDVNELHNQGWVAARYINWEPTPLNDNFRLEVEVKPFITFPAADVQEVRHGRWVSLTPPEMRTYETDVYFMCSECKNAVRFIANDLPYEHCPHCLARCEK